MGIFLPYVVISTSKCKQDNFTQFVNTNTCTYFIKNPFNKLLYVSVYDHLQGDTISSLKSQLYKHSCMYTRCGDLASYHVVGFGLCLWSFRVCVFLTVHRVCVFLPVH